MGAFGFSSRILLNIIFHIYFARNLFAPEASGPSKASEQRWSKWLPATKMEVWHQFGEDVSTVLETTAKGYADRWLKCMTTIIVSLGA